MENKNPCEMNRPVPTRHDAQDTSLAAAAKFEEDGGRRKSQVRSAIYSFIKGFRSIGATCDEVEVGLGLIHQTASSFIRTMVQDGLLKPTKQRRFTRNQRKAIVWVVADEQGIV